MFKKLEKINTRPKPFQFYTADELWTDEHTSKKMLEYHLKEDIDLSSRNRQFIDESVKWILSHFKVDNNTKIADFGCGPGLYTTEFAKNKAIVTGIDFSKRSINYAKAAANQKGLDINYYQKNYLEFETDDQFDLITMIFCDFCALSPFQRRNLLEKFHKFLKPEGSLLLDVHSLNTFNSRNEMISYEKNQLDGFWSPDDYYGFLNIFKYEKEKVSLDKYTIIEESRTRVIYNWLQYFSKESIQKEFKENGFIINEFYSDVAGTEYSSDSMDFAVIAKKQYIDRR